MNREYIFSIEPSISCPYGGDVWKNIEYHLKSIFTDCSQNNEKEKQ